MTPSPTPTSASDERGPLRLPKVRRYTVYFISIGTFVTGALWLYYHYFMRKQGQFGFQNNPLESLWQILHAGFSFAAVWALGWLWTTHVMRGWNMRWRRWSGGSLVGISIVLTVTGYALYYIGSRQWREWTAIAHWAIGLVALAIFLIHWLSKSLPYQREHGPYPWPWHRKRHPVERR